MKHRYLILTLVATLSLALTAGCATKKAPAPEQPTTAPTKTTTEQPKTTQTGMTEAPVTETKAAELTLKRIHFDFDQYVLTSESREALENNAAFMRAKPQVNVQIEGHCDERGSDNYNLALGENRARAAMEYLVSLGISPRRLDIISYGEERPLVSGSDEEAWSKNRRAEFVIR